MDSLKTISRDTLQPTRRFSATEQPSFSYAQFPRNRAVYLFGERLPFEDDEVFRALRAGVHLQHQ
ncbi:MAG: hypothetical protein RML35_14230 [Chloroherpetonaceae bacterium]|nr:hypothetical protein [Chloroherpetonaceae bacterium]